MRTPAFIASAILALMAACAQIEPASQPSAPATQPAPAPPRSAAPAAPPPEPPLVLPQAYDELDADTPPLPIAADLVGRDAAAVQAVLGKPDLIRAEPPAEFWQYVGESCVMLVFFFTGDGNVVPAAQRFHMLAGKQDGPVQRGQCFHSFVRRQQDRNTGS